MQGKYVNPGRALNCRRRLVTMQCDAFESATTLSSEPRSRVIDEYPPRTGPATLNSGSCLRLAVRRCN